MDVWTFLHAELHCGKAHKVGSLWSEFLNQDDDDGDDDGAASGDAAWRIVISSSAKFPSPLSRTYIYLPKKAFNKTRW